MAAPVLAAASLLGACGGDGDDGGSDEEYVRDVCTALAAFNERREELTAGATAADPAQVAEDFGDALSDLASAMDDADPPDDAAEAHDSVVQSLEDAADAVDEGGIEALFDVELPSVQMEPAVRNRLQALFNSTRECQGSSGIFS